MIEFEIVEKSQTEDHIAHFYSTLMDFLDVKGPLRP